MIVFKKTNYGENKHNSGDTTIHAEKDVIDRISFKHKNKKKKKIKRNII